MFLKKVAKAYPPIDLHIVVNNYATHKHPTNKAWLANPRVTMHLPRTSGSWMNMVEIFVGIITRQAIPRGVFGSVTELQAAITPGSSTPGTKTGTRSPGPKPPTKSCPTPPEVKEHHSRDTSRGDSAYGYSNVIIAIVRAGAKFSFQVAKNRAVNRAIGAILDDAWTPVRYPGAVQDPDTGNRFPTPKSPNQCPICRSSHRHRHRRGHPPAGHQILTVLRFRCAQSKATDDVSVVGVYRNVCSARPPGSRTCHRARRVTS